MRIFVGKKLKFILISVGILLLAGAVGLFFNRGGAFVWYVEAGYEDAWARILRQAEPPVKFKMVQVYSGEQGLKNQGVIISTGIHEDRSGENSLRVYPGLSRELEWQGCHVLALDPWMIFFKHTQALLSHDRIFSSASNEGTLLISGSEPEAVQAWSSRLSQDGPGSFSLDRDSLDVWGSRLFSSGLFPPDSQNFSWQEALVRLLGNETAWLYAPLSVIRNYHSPRRQILTAAGFPELNRNRYSLLAKILWARPYFSERHIKKQEEIISWLKNPEIQTIIADELGWIPADPYGNPYDPVSRTSQMHWLTSSFVYEISDFY